MRYFLPVILIAFMLIQPLSGGGGEKASGKPTKDSAVVTPIEAEMIKYLDSIRPELVSANQDIWTFAELGLEEHRSAARLVGVLKKAGFKVKEGVAGMPTAFVAEYGSGIADHRHPRGVRRPAGAVAGGRPAHASRRRAARRATAAGTAPWAPRPSAPPWPSRRSTTSTSSRAPSASTARRPRKR